MTLKKELVGVDADLKRVDNDIEEIAIHRDELLARILSELRKIERNTRP